MQDRVQTEPTVSPQATTYSTSVPVPQTSYMPDEDYNLYVCKLPPYFTSPQLTELFVKFGTIVSSKLLTDKGGKSRCSGFIKFATKDSAECALAELNDGRYLPGGTEPLLVKFANKSSSATTASSYTGFLKDSGGPIRNKSNPINRFNPMSYSGGQPTLTQAGSYPGVASGYPSQPTPYNSAQPSPYNAAQPAPYNTAQPTGQHPPTWNNTPPPQQNNFTQNGGQHSYSNPGQPGNSFNGGVQTASAIPPPTPEMVKQCFHQTQGWSLYIGNLGEKCTELTIYKLFAPFGAIASINAMIDSETGASKGYGFINMPQYDSAFEAVRLMHGLSVEPGKNLSVSFKVNTRIKKAPQAPGLITS